MEDNKIRVAITHGDTNGIGYEVIFKAFEDPMMLELCTPIISFRHRLFDSRLRLLWPLGYLFMYRCSYHLGPSFSRMFCRTPASHGAA